jgi:hypothetical protein
MDIPLIFHYAIVAMVVYSTFSDEEDEDEYELNKELSDY